MKMQMHRDTMVLLSLTALISAIFIICLPLIIKVKSDLTPVEKRYERFSHEKQKILERTVLDTSKIRSPMQEVENTLRNLPPEALADLAPVKDSIKGKGTEESTVKREQRLSLVLVKDGTKLAVVNGIVVREGDMAGDAQVRKITREGIMLRDKEGEKWLKIE
ncbi:MAG TPA: hypothetical protein VHO84_15045 [Syntrophorhabdaceae bacterium]|nr:hypothetical protein [Syntrophorhabdaceae bacterium]